LSILAALVSLNVHSVSAAPRAVKVDVVAGAGSENYGVFTAGAAGATIRLINRAELRLDPHSAVRLFPVPQKLQLSGNTKVSTWSVALVSGRVDAKLPPRTQTALLVSVGDLSVITTGGEFALLTKNQETIIASREGEVRTLLKSRWQDLTPGQALMLNAAHPTGVALETPKAPQTLQAQRVWFGADATPVSGFKWQPVSGATAYDVSLQRADNAQVLGTQRTKTNELKQTLASVPPGNYSVQVRSVDARGLEGNWSSATSLRVVGLKLPPGAYVADGRVFLGQNQRIEFHNADGIELSHINSKGYVPASAGLLFDRDKSTIVSVRLPGDSDVSVLRLEPRSVYASVRVGPKLAVWPTDKITINVELKNKQGQPVPAWVEPVAKVLLGTEPLNVHFERSGNMLTASVDPVAGKGPWILRVEVEDQYGVPLGRDFVEITSNRRARPPADPSRSARR
jgi:hypothetical protein